jgi:hypothetical protein
MAVYKCQILRPPEVSSVNGDLFFDTNVQRRTGSAGSYVWVDVANGHRTTVINSSVVSAINSDPNNNTAAKKRTAFEAYVKQLALSWLIDQADDAEQLWEGWYPGISPTNPLEVTIRSV